MDDGPNPDSTTDSTFYSPPSDPSNEESSPVIANFEGFTASKNCERGIWLRGENELVTEATLADNRAGRPSRPRRPSSKVTKHGCDLAGPNDWCEGAADSLAELDASTYSAYYYDATAKRLYLKLVSNGYDWEELEVGPS